MLLFLNIIYVLIAVAMIALILMQRGAGAQAGSGFGGGASGTVFGARGSANFLSKSTKWLAVAFFVISLAMAWNATRTSAKPEADSNSVMAQAPATTGAPAPASNGAVPAAPVLPSANGGAIPAAPVATPSSVPAAPSNAAPAPNSSPTGG